MRLAVGNRAGAGRGTVLAPRRARRVGVLDVIRVRSCVLDDMACHLQDGTASLVWQHRALHMACCLLSHSLPPPITWPATSYHMACHLQDGTASLAWQHRALHMACCLLSHSLQRMLDVPQTDSVDNCTVRRDCLTIACAGISSRPSSRFTHARLSRAIIQSCMQGFHQHLQPAAHVPPVPAPLAPAHAALRVAGTVRGGALLPTYASG